MSYFTVSTNLSHCHTPLRSFDLHFRLLLFFFTLSSKGVFVMGCDYYCVEWLCEVVVWVMWCIRILWYVVICDYVIWSYVLFWVMWWLVFYDWWWWFVMYSGCVIDWEILSCGMVTMIIVYRCSDVTWWYDWVVYMCYVVMWWYDWVVYIILDQLRLNTKSPIAIKTLDNP